LDFTDPLSRHSRLHVRLNGSGRGESCERAAASADCPAHSRSVCIRGRPRRSSPDRRSPFAFDARVRRALLRQRVPVRPVRRETRATRLAQGWSARCEHSDPVALQAQHDGRGCGGQSPVLRLSFSYAYPVPGARAGMRCRTDLVFRQIGLMVRMKEILGFTERWPLVLEGECRLQREAKRRVIVRRISVRDVAAVVPRLRTCGSAIWRAASRSSGLSAAAVPRR